MNEDEPKYYHPKCHPETYVRLAYLDGLAKKRLGIDGRKRYPDGDKALALLCGAAERFGQHAADGEDENAELPTVEDLRRGRVSL